MTTAPAVVPPLPGDRRLFTPLITFVIYAGILLVGGVLGYAAFQKLIGSSSGALSYLVAAAEVAIIALLVVMRRQWFAWAGVATLFAAFAGYTGYLFVRGEASCGCFGDIETAPIVTFGLDLALMSVSMIIAMALAGTTSIAGGLLTTAGVAAITGAGFSVLSHDPLASTYHGDRAGLVLASIPEAATADLTGPDYLVYLYNEESEEAPVGLESMRNDARLNAGDDALRVIVMTTAEAEANAGVPEWAWEHAPSAILYRGGQTLERYTPETMPDPRVLRTSRPVGPIRQVLAQPKYGDITYATEDLPVYLLYVYNPECPICLQHLVLFRNFQDEHPNDRLVVVEPISMEEIQEELGIELWQWPGVPTTYVVRAGRVIAQTVGPNLIPNAFQIRSDLEMGRPMLLPKPGDDGHEH